MEDIEGEGRAVSQDEATHPANENVYETLRQELENDPGDEALRRRLGKSVAVAMDEELRELRAKVAAYEATSRPVTPVEEGVCKTPAQLWHAMLGESPERRADRLAFMLEAIDAGHRIAWERDELRLQVERMGNLELVCAGLRGQVEAYQHMLASGHAAHVQLMERLTAPQVTYETRELSVDGMEELPPWREEPSVAEKISQQFKTAGIDRNATCGYAWEGEATDGCDAGVHECRLTNPLHLGDHACDDQWCGQILSQEAAEKIEEAKRSDDSGK